MVLPEALPVVAFAILCGNVQKSGATEEFTASFTPARLAAKPGERSVGCMCDLEVLETNLDALTDALGANGYPHHIHNPTPPFQAVTIDFGWGVTVWEARAKLVRILPSGITFSDTQYFCSLSGDVDAYPELVIFDKRADRPRITIRQNLSEAGRDTPPTPYTGEQWGAFLGALQRSGLFQPGMLLLEDPDVDDDIDYFAVDGVLTHTAEQQFDRTLTTILQLFPKT